MLLAYKTHSSSQEGAVTLGWPTGSCAAAECWHGENQQGALQPRREEREGAAPSPKMLHCLLPRTQRGEEKVRKGGGRGSFCCFRDQESNLCHRSLIQLPFGAAAGHCCHGDASSSSSSAASGPQPSPPSALRTGRQTEIRSVLRGALLQQETGQEGFRLVTFPLALK